MYVNETKDYITICMYNIYENETNEKEYDTVQAIYIRYLVMSIRQQNIVTYRLIRSFCSRVYIYMYPPLKK